MIKEDLIEEEYYRLKMLEKDWPGLHAVRIPRRDYPLGKVASDVIGFMGSINKTEYDSVLNEMSILQEVLKQWEEGDDPELPGDIKDEEEVAKRLKALQAHAYTANDFVGKMGIEGRFEQDLRGFHGRRTYYSDARGNFIRELPGSRPALAGQRILLTPTPAELQEYAEELLTLNEKIRDTQQQEIHPPPQPWMRGGAIVAMDPNTGELLALASYPRYDPNDFIPSGNPEQDKLRQRNIHKWFEDENTIGEIWDQKRGYS